MTTWQSWVVVGAGIATLVLALLDTTSVSTAAPSIARDFGGGAVSQVPWLTVVYALAQTVTQPLYGKLTDRYGPRRLLLTAISLFTAGSLACGLAGSMNQLIALRAVQGLGAAGLMSVTFVLLGHLRLASGRSDAGGNTAGGVVLAFGLIVGPLTGGTIVEHIGWRWIFWVNLPVGLAVLAVMAVWLRLPGRGADQRRAEPVDWAGAALLAAAAGAFQLVFSWGGSQYPWDSWPVLVTAGAGVAAGAGFAARQRRAAQPFFPPYLLRQVVLRRLSLLQLAAGTGMAAGTIYLTLDLQLVHHLSPTRAGLQIIPMAAGVAAGAAAGSAVLRRARALRPSLIWSGALCAVALGVLAAAVSASPAFITLVPLPILGLGIGLALGNELLIVQGIVPLADLGTATTGIRFVETLGTSAGAAVFAAVFAHYTAQQASPGAVTSALTVIFAIGAAIMAAAAVVAARLPADLPVR